MSKLGLPRLAVVALSLNAAFIGASGADVEETPVPTVVRSVRIGSGRCRAAVPAGWIWLKRSQGLTELVHDGAEFGDVTITAIREWNLPGGRQLAALGPDTLYAEAELILALPSTRADSDRLRLRSLSVAPNASLPMVEAELSFWRKEVEYRRLIDGWVDEGWLYIVTFEAPAIAYFERNRADYREFVSSICAGR